MTHQQIIDYCLKKAGAYEDYPFGPDSFAIKSNNPLRLDDEETQASQQNLFEIVCGLSHKGRHRIIVGRYV